MYNRLFLSILLVAFLCFLSSCSDDDNPTEPDNNEELKAELVINEFLASNNSLLADDFGEYEDWIEIYNLGTAGVDIAGYTLTDDLDEPDKWRIKTNNSNITTIPAGGYLLIWADEDTLQGILHAGFKLSADGEDIGLFEPDGTLLDIIHFGPQYTDITMGRTPNGSTTWAYLTEATPLARNSLPYNNLAPMISSIYHDPAVPREGQAVQIEVEAYDDKGVEEILLAYRLIGDAFTFVTLEENSGEWRGFIPGQARGSEVQYYIIASDEDGLETTDPEFSPTVCHSFIVPDTDYAPPIFINEFLADNATVNRDEAGDYDDWIELYNAGTEAIDLAGMYISDSPDDPFRFQFPSDDPMITTIPAGGFLLLWADDETNEGALHLDFKLSADGESILLHASDANQNVLIDSFNFDEQQEDLSMGRLPDASSHWAAFSIPTPGSSNNQ